MFEKIKTNVKPWLMQLNDPRTLGLVAFGVIALLVTWSGIKAVQTNYELQKQISVLEQETQVQELENQNLDLQNQYLNTDQFLELAARRQFGLAAPGEKLILVPKTVAMAHTLNLDSKPNDTKAITVVNKPAYQRNFQAWINFFFHRPTNQ